MSATEPLSRDDALLSCPHCPMTLKTQEQMDAHIEQEHGTVPPPEPNGAPRQRRRRYNAADDVIGAIRLALEGGHSATTATQMAVIEKLVSYAPPTPGNATEPVKMFLRAIREAGGRIVIGAP